MEPVIRRRFDFQLDRALPVAMRARDAGGREELAITALVAGNCEKLGEIERLDEETVDRVFDVFVHIGMYVPPLFGVGGNGARLPVVAGKRESAMAKYSDWVRLGKESHWRVQLLSCCCPMMVIGCLKDNGEAKQTTELDDGCLSSYQVQKTPVNDGVLPGVIRQLVIE